MFKSPYHPQTNGLIGRLNKTHKKEIVVYIDPCHKTWDQIFPFVTHTYNTSVHASTRITLFEHSRSATLDSHHNRPLMSWIVNLPTWIVPLGGSIFNKCSPSFNKLAPETYKSHNNARSGTTTWVDLPRLMLMEPKSLFTSRSGVTVLGIPHAPMDQPIHRCEKNNRHHVRIVRRNRGCPGPEGFKVVQALARKYLRQIERERSRLNPSL